MKIEFYAAIFSFLMVALFGIYIVPLLAKLKFGQTVRSDGPKRHFKKMGTPTMGGIMFIPAIAISTLVFSNRSANVQMAIFSMAAFTMIGFVDDFIKIIKKRSLGLRANHKLLFQLIIAFILAFYARSFYPGTTVLPVPGFSTGLDFGLIFIPFTVFVILGTVNSVNLTDGLDGLVSGIVIIISFFYTLISLLLDNYGLAVFGAAISGGCLGFLIYNHHPARVFMGDTGSLGLGGALAAMAVLTGTQIYLILFGMIFIIETISVILQVIFYRTTGKRIFKMSPIHHHFELIGWSEEKVVLVFWAFTLFTGVLGMALFNATGLR
ncbi:MAG TPA: phospho-N-acetylmuramoyl-pentapeptide-transferase [Thermoanaerobacterales bacterium]|nr:phospho-N-acetylmuramoyl-pentapeptide-transferase [Thermoanaerobacterales bacterium]